MRVFFARSAILGALIICSTVCFAGANRPESLQTVLKQVVEQVGPILPPESYPAIYQTLDGIVQPLSDAQKRESPNRQDWSYKLYVLDSLEPSASSYTDLSGGDRKIVQHIFITTGFINKMLGKIPFGATDQMQFNIGRALIAGACAHELAHAIDLTDSYQIHDHYTNAANQAIETRTDIEALRYLREAGFPANSLLLCLQKLFVNRPSSGWQSLLNTHPQSQLRLTVLEMAQTVMRYEFGDYDITQMSSTIPTNLSDELGKTKSEEATWQFVEPRSIEEAVSRIESLAKTGDSKRVDYTRIEFNRLLLWIDKQFYQLQQSQKAPNGEDLTAFDRLIALLVDRDNVESRWGNKITYLQDLVMDREQLAEDMTSDNGSNAFSLSPSHFEYLKKIHLYSSERVEKTVRKKLDYLFANNSHLTGSMNSSHSWNTNFSRLKTVMPPATLISRFKNIFVEYLEKNLATDSIHLRMDYATNLSEMPPEFYFYLLQLYNQLNVNMDTSTRLAWFLSSKPDMYFPLPKSSTNGFTVIGTGQMTLNEAETNMKFLNLIRRYWSVLTMRAKRGDPNATQVVEDFRNSIQLVWDMRGVIAVTEFMANSSLTDWDWVMDVLGIEHRMGYSMIRSDVKAYTSGRKNYDSYGFDLRYSQLVAKFKREDAINEQNHQIKWLDNALYPYLAGDLNPEIKETKELSVQARKTVAAAYSIARPGALAALYRKKFREIFEKTEFRPGKAIIDFNSVHAQVLETLFGTDQMISARYLFTSLHPYQFWIELIDGSQLSLPLKKELLMSLLLLKRSTIFTTPDGRTLAQDFFWEANPTKSILPVYKIAKRYGVYADFVDFINKIKDTYHVAGYSRYFDLIADFGKEIKEELPGAELESYSLLLNKEWESPNKYLPQEKIESLRESEHRFVANGPGVVRVKADIVQAAIESKIPVAKALQIFDNLTQQGGNEPSDLLFESYILPSLSELPAVTLEKSLLQGRIKSARLRVRLTERAYEAQIEAIAAFDPTKRVEAARSLVKTIVQILPSASFEKDAFLEKLAWKWDLHGSDLYSIIEENKSYNWKTTNPFWTNAASGGVEYLTGLNSQTREELIRFLLNPLSDNMQLPPKIRQDISDFIFDQTVKIREALNRGQPVDRVKIRAEADLKASFIAQNLEGSVVSLEPLERVPFLVLLLRHGKGALMNRPDYLTYISRKYLGYAPYSDEEKFLQAYFNVIPDEERATSLAYLLCQSDEDGDSFKRIFEVFNSVGKKFAQLGATWQIFGQERSEQLQGLKSRAEAMSKYEIEQVLKNNWPASAHERIQRFVKVLGAASMKTVVLVQLNNGEYAVLMVQDPNIRAQIKSDLARGRRFLDELQKSRLSPKSSMLKPVVDALETQLNEEVEMKNETEKARRAGQLFAAVAQDMATDMRGWKFSVPTEIDEYPQTNSAVLMSLAHGIEFNDLDQTTKNEVGEILVQSSLRMLFQYGQFDPDRHRGNWLIDVKGRTIYPIDFGQLESFIQRNSDRYDPRFVLANFIRALAANDVNSIIYYAGFMSNSTAISDYDGLKAQLSEILGAKRSLLDRLVDGAIKWLPFSKNQNGEEDSTDDFSNKIIAIVDTLSRHGLTFEKRYSFGALKGLMLLYGENYVSPNRFKEILAGEIKKLLVLRQPPKSTPRTSECARFLTARE